ncbi:MAG: hypothetical protein H0V89_02410, partial [Deltaproteobacteria bacterium]|nr:hypothetical protein [Deltaproteobacteria bacterium]
MARALASGAGEGCDITVVGDAAAFGPSAFAVIDPGDIDEPVEVASIRWA